MHFWLKLPFSPTRGGFNNEKTKDRLEKESVFLAGELPAKMQISKNVGNYVHYFNKKRLFSTKKCILLLKKSKMYAILFTQYKITVISMQEFVERILSNVEVLQKLRRIA